jgi:hypothetical protein
LVNDLAIRKVELATERTNKGIDLANNVLSGVRDVAITAIRSPVIQMVVSTVLIEYLQTVWIKETTPSGIVVEKKLLSDVLGSTLEGVIITTGALQVLANSFSIEDLLKIITR